MPKQQTNKNLSISIKEPEVPFHSSKKKHKHQSKQYSNDIETRQKYHIAQMQMQVKKLTEKIDSQKNLLKLRIQNQQLENMLKKNQIASKMSKKEIILSRLNQIMQKQSKPSLQKNKSQINRKLSNNKVALLKKDLDYNSQIKQKNIHGNNKVKFTNSKINAQLQNTNQSQPNDRENSKKKYEIQNGRRLELMKNFMSLRPIISINRTQSEKYIRKQNYDSLYKHKKYQKHNQQRKIQKIKQILQKQRQYGNRVEKQYYNNRSKSAQSYLQTKRLFQIKEMQQVEERNNKIMILKKPQVPLIKNPQDGRVFQIDKIIKSPSRAQDKLYKLNYLSGVEVNRVQRAEAKKNQQDYQTLYKINTARAGIMLDNF